MNTFDIKKSRTTINPLLMGEWTDGKSFYRFETDGACYIGRRNVPYKLSEDGMTLTFGSKTLYHRTDGDVNTGFAGTWKDESENEEIQYRTDGRYVCLFSNEKPVYGGIYKASQDTFTSYELRQYVITENNKITFYSLYFPPSTCLYTISGNVLSITFEDQTTEYTRVHDFEFNS